MTGPRGALRGATIALCGDFAAGATPAVAAALRALGACVPDGVTTATTHLVRGARSEALVALLGPSALERDADARVAAGQPVAKLTEADLDAWLARATPHTSLCDALRSTPPADAPRVTDVPGAAIPAALTAGTLDARVAAAESLARRGDREAIAALEAAAPTAPHEVLAAATRALLARSDDDALKYLAARLADARLADDALRDRLARTLEARGDGPALAALADALGALRGVCGLHEAAAFGRTVARGVTRWGRPAPLALEFEAPREGEPAADLLGLASRAGAHQALTDERGVVVHRVRIASLPRPPADASARREVPLYALLAHVGTRRSGRFWIAGVALPAALPWPVWLAVLGPLADRTRRPIAETPW